jgi:hypothetical protein
LVVVGTSQHAANIEVGAQAVSVFELLLRTLVFF